MAEPIRSATSDANEGVVNPPAARAVARQTTARQQQVDSFDIGVEQFSNALGNALAGFVQDKSTNINEKRMIAAAQRQGADHAINTIDANKKRTGWEEAVFGQNVEYRAAQQRAVQNSTQAAYLEQAVKIDEFAGETPEEYQAKLTSSLDKILEPYANDPETKDLITKTWAVSSAKLTAKQMEAHYAYNQQQQRDTVYKQHLQAFDTWNVDANLASSPEEVEGQQKEISMYFSGLTKPKGMSDIAWRGTMNEALQTSLRQGNIGAYKAAEKNGWLKTLNAAEQVSMDRAISAYDTDYSQRASLMFEEAELAALNAKSIDEAIGLYIQFSSDIDSLEARSSGTELALLQEKTRGLSKAEALRDKKRSLLEKAAKAAKEAEDDLARATAIENAVGLTDPFEREAAIQDLKPTKKELDEASDSKAQKLVSKWIGSEEILSKGDVFKMLQKDPSLSRKLARHYQHTELPPLVQSYVETATNGIGTLVDENDRFTADAKNIIESIAPFEADNVTFKTVIGKQAYDTYQVVKSAVVQGKTGAQMAKMVDDYNANKTSIEQLDARWRLGKKESKRDFITKIHKMVTGDMPNTEALAFGLREVNEGLRVHGGDFNKAVEYWKDSLKGDVINYAGSTIQGKSSLNDATEFNFETLMDNAQASKGDAPSMLTPYLAALGVDVREGVPRKLSDLKGVRLYTTDGVEGFFIDSDDAQAPVHVPVSTMERWASKIRQDKKMSQLVNEASDKTYDKLFEENDLLRQYAPYGAGL